MVRIKTIIATVVLLVVAGVASADLTAVSNLDVVVASSPGDARCTDLSLPSDSPIIADLDTLIVEVPIEADTSLPVQQKDVKVLSDGSNSLNLCLSALISLGLCGSAQFVRKASFGFVPDWYHSGSTRQIGHSHAVLPDFSSSVPAYCFIQPVSAVTDPLSLSKYRHGMIKPLWRKSQFNPSAQALRGPPSIS